VDASAAHDPRVIEAALCLHGGLGNVEKVFDQKTLEAADRRRGSTSLQEVLVEAARANGYHGPARISAGNVREVLASGFATHSISNVLAATYGKFLLQGYTAVEAAWDQIASIRSVSDYKTVTGVRLNGGFDFEDVGPSGELKSADASDETRTIKAKLTGRMSSITMVDIVNDDLGALTQVPARLGRGAAVKLNKDFWTEFQASNSSFYRAETAAAGNALQISSLRTAVASYRKLTDPDGNPLGITPQLLLVPPELEMTAEELMGSSVLITGENATRGNVNVFAGRFRVVSSAYLTSGTTWWLMANPAELPAMEVAFLNGQRLPTVQQAEADFHMLGIQVRGHFSYGVAKAEARGAYRMATA
jgi:phage major head subunit gpT-like protein